MTPTISILGLYYATNGRVFDNLLLPAGVEKEILVPDLLEACSDFGLLYPDGDFMQMIIGVWSKKELPIWEAMYNSTQLEYNPIENYDRYEEVNREISSESSAESSAESSGNTKTQNDGTNTLGKTSFDSYKFRDAQQETSEGSSSSDNTGESSQESSQESSGKEKVISHMHGNIGVTTAAQMIQGYRDISQFSIYDFIVDSFINRFCIQLY